MLIRKRSTCSDKNANSNNRPRAHAIMSAMQPVRLEDWGWREEWGRRFPPSDQHAEVGRVVREDRRRLRIMTQRGARLAAGRGRDFAHSVSSPCVGDWVSLSADERAQDLAQVIERYPRASQLMRQTSDGTQIIAANVDHAWLLVDACREPNPAALERYLIAIEESGAEPVMLVSKVDLNQDWRSLHDRFGELFPDVQVLGVSVIEGEGVDVLLGLMQARHTYCLVGESGAGKSTLLNRLADREVARTGEVRGRDGKGRHVTTHRELCRLPSGALMLDTPGMREFIPVLLPGVIPKRFKAIRELAEGCRFSDCRHLNEPDCAVQLALREGRLAKPLLDNYHRLLA